MAYVSLAQLYWHKDYWDTYYSEDFLDSVLILVNTALSYDDQLSDAYRIKGDYFKRTGKVDQAIEEYNRTIEYNPNDWMSYMEMGWLFWPWDMVNMVATFHKAASLCRGPELPEILLSIAHVLRQTGFVEESISLNRQALTLNGDSAAYYENLARSELLIGNYERAIDFGERGFAIDTSRMTISIVLGTSYLYHGQYEKSLKFFERYIENLKAIGEFDIYNMPQIGYCYWKNGLVEEAEFYFDEQIKYYEEMIKLNRLSRETWVYHDVAAVYAFRGQNDEALKSLEIRNEWDVFVLQSIMQINNDPLFNNIRDEPEFQQIVKDIEAKYQAEHERIRKWLEENRRNELYLSFN